MHSTTRTTTTFELELADRFVWSKRGGRQKDREFIVATFDVEASTDPERAATLTLHGPWLTPLSENESEHIRLNGWDTFYDRYDADDAAKLPERVLEAAASAGFVVPVLEPS